MSREGPFPGMDPWLERSWGDIHQAIITYARDALNRELPEPLAARVEERVFVESPLSADRYFVPDVRIVQYPAPHSPGTAAVAIDPEVDAAAPYFLDFSSVEMTEGYIEIRDYSSGGRVVTLIELVSRSNKAAGEGRDKYLQKQREALDAKVNVIEIDLLRAGAAVTLAGQRRGIEQVQCPFHASIHRQAKPNRVEFFPILLRSRLPRLRIPLRADDTDVVLDVQSLLTHAYVAARYAMTIDYERKPDPALSPEDGIWARECIQAWRASAQNR